MEYYRCKYSPCETADECDKLIQIASTNPADDSGEKHHGKTERILGPFHTCVCFPAAGEETVLEDTDCREELERNG